jgi:hypothetical protein
MPAQKANNGCGHNAQHTQEHSIGFMAQATGKK